MAALVQWYFHVNNSTLAFSGKNEGTHYISANKDLVQVFGSATLDKSFSIKNIFVKSV